MSAVQTKEAVIALLGQPNSGKSTLFNGLTGLRQHVGNWPGKTVEQKEGYFHPRRREIHGSRSAGHLQPLRQL